MRRLLLLLALSLLAAGCQKKLEASPPPADTAVVPPADKAVPPGAHEVSGGVVEPDAPSASDASKPKKPTS